MNKKYNMQKNSLLISSAQEMVKLGIKLGKKLKKNIIIAFNGDIGVGKTTFIKGIAKSLGIRQEIKSPTFNIIKCYYDGSIPLYHIDAYRLENNNDDIGLEEYINSDDGITVIEWSKFIKKMLNNVEYLSIEIKYWKRDVNKRKVFFKTNSAFYRKKIINILQQ